MDSFPKEMMFKFPWRSYQERVLSELEEHLDDNKLHVVAAPGSGKTILGIEVIRRSNRPTLILSPTLTIRNQWVDRLINLFFSPELKEPDWISTDIRKPKFLTVVTYQALHCAYSGKSITETEETEPEEEEKITSDENEINCTKKNKKDEVDVVSLLKKIGVKTIVLDEAHHLRTEWWKSLIAVTEELEKIRIVALTATPPFDVPLSEWKNYVDLCGPIDTEISVPELVLKQDLCPHQDYVYLSMPSIEETRRIEEFRINVNQFVSDLCQNLDFITALKAHPWMKDPEAYVEDILSNPEYFTSMVVFLYHVERQLPEQFFRIMGVSEKRLPTLTFEWLEKLLTGCFYFDSDNFIQYENTMKDIHVHLSRMGAIERRKIFLKNTKEINKLLMSSITKLESITQIVKIESSALKTDLRMVILTDFIRKSELPKTQDDIKPLNKIGVIPIFERLRREKNPEIKLGILSGSLIVIPKESLELFNNTLAQSGINSNNITTTPLKHDENYLIVDIHDRDKHRIVQLMTNLFSSGGITVLVGTKSLLGEGWDAPSINSLILASFVGSYMLSNQMRGRAIRTQPGNPNKTANIWHLVCIEQKSIEDKIKESLYPTPREQYEQIKEQIYPTIKEHYRNDVGEDFEMLSRRFKAFVGVSFKEIIIENGIQRLDLGNPPFSAEKIYKINIEMGKRALDRDGLKARWDAALQRGKEGMRVVEEIRMESVSMPKNLIFSKTITALLKQGITTAVAILSSLYSAHPTVKTEAGLYVFLLLIAFIFILAAIASAPAFLKALWLFLRYGPIESSMKQIAEALLKTLAYNDIIKTDISKLGVSTETNKQGIILCSLKGGTSYEKALFITCLQEILDPIENPRYLIVRKSMFRIIERKDYHAVPQVIGAKKEYAEYFEKMWKKYVGPTELIYTRTIEGRRILLSARTHALSTAFQKRSERCSCWK